ncbi:Ig-like domain-containing protein [Bacillus sp. V3]|nr:Ig-like domain-containing protein [Bacillus sp. V3]
MKTLLIALLFIIISVYLSPIASADQRVSNDFLDFVVADNGRFTIGTTGGNEQSLDDDNKLLLYGHPNPGTSYTTLNIDGQIYYFEADIPGSTDFQNLSHTSEQVIGDIKVKQVLSLVKNLNTNKDDTVEVKYIVSNTGTQAHDFGLRIMMDTMLGGNDQAPFKVPGTGDVVTETEYTGNDIPQYWEVFDSLTNPTVIAHGTLFNSTMVKPDKVQFTNWSRVRNTPWDYSILSGYSNEDSAVSIYWNPNNLSPGESKEFKTFYGISEHTQDLRPPLTLSVTGASIVEATSEGYNPNPFIVTAYVSNIGSSFAENVNISLDLPDGLMLSDGYTLDQTLGNIEVGEERQVSWEVLIEPTEELKTLPYTINLNASNTDTKSLTRYITIPSNQIITDLELTPESLDLVNGESHQLQLTGLKSDGSTIDLTSSENGTSYSSSNSSIAQVDENGLITIPADSIGGTAYIRAYYNGQTVVSTINVVEPGPESIVLNPSSITLERGNTHQLTGKVIMTDGTENDITNEVTYSSDNSELASVDENGLITIPENSQGGTVYIRGSYQGMTSYTTVTIPSLPSVDSLTFEPGNVTLGANETLQLQVTANMTDDTQKDVTTDVSYSSSNESLATVDENGLITVAENTLSGGSVYIRGSFEGKGSYTVLTIQPRPTFIGVEFETTNLELNIGETHQVRAMANMSDSSQVDVTSEVTYSSSNSAIAVVNESGLISVPETSPGGTVYIRGSYSGKGTYLILAVPPPPSVTELIFIPSSLTLKAGESEQLRVLAKFSDGTEQDVTAAVSYSSSNTSLATVDSEGVIKIKDTTSYGTVYIRGNYRGKGSYSIVTVPRPPTVSSLTFDPSSVTIGSNQTYQVTVFANMSDGTRVNVTDEVTYSTSNGNLATVDSNGLITTLGDTSGGKVYVRGNYGGKGSYTTVTIPPPPSVTSLTFEPGDITIERGETYQLRVMANMSDGTQKDVTSQVAYSTSNSGLASANNTGLITAVQDSGGGTVYIRGNYGGKGSYTTVTIPPPPSVTSLTFEPGNVTLNREETQQLRVIANMSDGTQLDVTSEVSYSTSNSSLSEVDENGLITIPVTANSGSVYIRGSYGGKGSYTTVTIPPQPTVSALTFEAETTVLSTNESVQVRVFAEYSDGSRKDVTSSVSFSSSNTSLATVDESGLATINEGVSSGSVYIRGSFGGKGGYITLQIN